jgi:hypothetical protein
VTGDARLRRLRCCCSAAPKRSRGGTGGRSSLVDCGVRLIFEGLGTSRPGIRRGSLSRNGRDQPELAAHSRNASLARRSWAFLGARARPGNARGVAVTGTGSVTDIGDGLSSRPDGIHTV